MGKRGKKGDFGNGEKGEPKERKNADMVLVFKLSCSIQSVLCSLEKALRLCERFSLAKSNQLERAE